MDNLSYLSNADSSYIDGLYQSYKENPESVDYSWQKFFEGFDLAKISGGDAAIADNPEHFTKELRVLALIDGYRSRGHLFSKTNPVRERRKYTPGKELSTFGLSDADLDTVFNAGEELGLGAAPLKKILEVLEQTYCGTIGVEYKFIRNSDKVKWLQEKMEKAKNIPSFSADVKKQLFKKINEAVLFESFLGTKFLGQKRFSLEGHEGLIPAMDLVIERGAELGVREFIIGMAHRGRLNVLTNIMQKSYSDIFAEFEGKHYDEKSPFSGDVKYHMGYSSDVKTKSGNTVHLSLCPNPSHLETVDAVIEGISRAKIDTKYEGDNLKVVPIMIHGDAALAGQGICYEVVQMAKLKGYKTGGTIHLVVNNQIGFTTDYKDARSSTYCTDLGKIISAPIFHVNGDDAEAISYVINLAVEYRQKYKSDVFIDILGYRRFGHNESDEPKFTQPTLYKIIDKHPNPREVYMKRLVAEGTIDEAYAKSEEKKFKDHLQGLLDEVKKAEKHKGSTATFEGVWKNYHIPEAKEMFAKVKTEVKEADLLAVGKKLTDLPKDIKFFKKTEKLFEDRAKMVNETKVFDWAMGELMAYGTLLKEGFDVRLSGEDVKRGTFSHRHAVIFLEDSDEEFVPMRQIDAKGQFRIFNSHLSEYGVLGFEYGYAMAHPNSLTIWEAQFGDFSNGAQIVIDQFVASAESKWQRANGLVMLLPHGYEGQGPEHSSARMERYLELCAEYNIQVLNCTTPANIFHALRRQLKRDFRKPLVVFTPKSLLRHPACVSHIDEFTKEGFQEVIDDANVEAKNVKRVLFCTGKVYYDLLDRQQKDGVKDIAIVRLEQIYPTPEEQLKAIVKKYSNAKEFIWVQEESENMGAWPYLCRRFRKSWLDLDVIARPESSAPATGFSKQHSNQQKSIVDTAFKK